jgi:rhodanese-related sulfurtransferase
MQNYITFLNHHLALTIGIACLIVLLLLIEGWRMKKSLQGLSPQAAISLINHEQAVIIDIRTPEAFKQGHIVHAQNISATAVLIDKKIEKLKNKPLIIVCAAGISAKRVAEQLSKKGLTTHVLQGGMTAWHQANLPTIKEVHHA